MNMADKDNVKNQDSALVDDNNAPTFEETKESSAVEVVKPESQDNNNATSKEESKDASTVAAPVVDKTAKDRIAAAQKAAKKEEREQARKQAKIDKKAKKAAEYQSKIEQCPKDYRPVSTGVFFWCGLLCVLPVIGLLFTLIFSLFPINKNFKNFARAILAWYVIAIIVFLIFAIVVTLVMGQSIADYIWPFEQFFDQIGQALGI